MVPDKVLILFCDGSTCGLFVHLSLLLRSVVNYDISFT